MRRSGNYWITGILGLLVMLSAFLLNRTYTVSLENIAGKASLNIEDKSHSCEMALDLLFREDPDSSWKKLNRIYEEEKVGIYFFTGDNLRFWNNSQIPLKQKPSDFKNQNGLIKLDQGYYIYFKKQIDSITGIALCLVKPAYALENNYLKNDFVDWLEMPQEIKLDTTSRNTSTGVLLNGECVFSIKGNDQNHYYDGSSDSCFVIFLVGFVILLASVLMYTSSKGSGIVKALGSISLIIAFRFVMLWLKWPAFIYRSSLYDLKLFGNAQSALNGYLGDIFLNAICIVSIVFIFYFHFSGSAKIKNRWIEPLISFLLFFIIVHQFNQTAISLITNSTLSFDFIAIFNVKPQVFVGLAALGFYSITLFLLVYRSCGFFSGNALLQVLKACAYFAAIGLSEQLFYSVENYYENYWLLLYAPLIFVLLKFARINSTLALGIQIVITAFITSSFFTQYINKNQHKDLEFLSYELSERKDDILENEFSNIPVRIKQDGDLNNLMSIVKDVPNAGQEISLLLKQKYFGGYFDRYTVDFSLFDDKCTPLLPIKRFEAFNEGFFEDQIKNNADSAFVEGLFLVNNGRKNSQYIGRITLGTMRLYILMEPKQYEELGSFPDLLVDRSQQKPERLKNFSHAVYRSRQISSRYGDFNYPFFLPDSATLTNSNSGFAHHFFHPDESTDLIISQEARGWNYFFTFNSYLLLFFALLTVIMYIMYSWFFARLYTSPTLTRRIQTIIILLLVLAMTAVGVTSGKLVTGQFEKNNKKQLEEKTRIIINELSEQFKPQQLFDASQKELVNLKLKEYARLFNTPISLFSNNGSLFNTSESKFYELGLAAPLVNPRAFNEVKLNRSSSESVNARAGTLKYKSLYTPLFNEKKELTGFLNLPYFARQNDLANELSGIISALINVYVILFVISILSGLILSGLITQPLRIIKQQLANITLGKQNEKIVWQSNDEIGKLVSEYNQMLIKLEQSANLLAQSERESAWREMAKQVAHEIKNPLTPMKLNLQYLQHLMKNNPEDFNEKFEKASVGIIEQIDALATIASEFSNFAKLPTAQLQNINLAEIINSSVLIFENQKDIQIENTILEQELLVRGDREQCLRVFNNILKNAVQAVEESKDPKISISCKINSDMIIISIIDNGCGIDDELKSKIFTPNFTTKSTGSGLGLAMVKNILQGFGGKIEFESQKEQGSSFYLEFVRA